MHLWQKTVVGCRLLVVGLNLGAHVSLCKTFSFIALMPVVVKQILLVRTFLCVLVRVVSSKGR